MTAGAGPVPARRRRSRRGRPSRRGGLVLVCSLVGVLGVVPGCSRKLTSGGSALEVLAYDVLGMDRGTSYYYETLRSAHERATFDYKATEDPFLADKCVDAVLKLGEASFSRLEGQVQAIVLLAEVAVEDPIILAKMNAYEALAKTAFRLPVVPAAPQPERGDQFLALLRELDGLHDEQGRRRQDTPATRQRVASIVERIGAFDLPTYQLVKSGVSWFPSRRYITQETDVALRDVFDRSMVRRSRALILSTLEGGILESNPLVRRSALQGLKLLGHAPALAGVIERIPLESSPLVRSEITEYLAAIGGRTAAEALVGMVDDDDPSVRWKARSALTRLAGTDLGRERDAWQAWVERGAPSLPTVSPQAVAPTVPYAPPAGVQAPAPPAIPLRVPPGGPSAGVGPTPPGVPGTSPPVAPSAGPPNVPSPPPATLPAPVTPPAAGSSLPPPRHIPGTAPR